MNKTTIKLCEQHLFDSDEELIRLSVPSEQKSKIERIREMYVLWISNPKLKRKDILSRLSKRGKVSLCTLYQDLGIVEMLIGNLNKVSKDFMRWQVYGLYEEALSIARDKESADDIRKIADSMAKYALLDKEDVLGDALIKPLQPFIPTTDVTSIGIKPIENLEEVKRRLYKKYGEDDDLSDVEWEEVDLQASIDYGTET